MQIKSFFRPFEQKIKRITKQAPLPTALVLVVLITVVLTCTSVTIYYTSGASKLDLSRPGFESERTEVRTNETSKTYDTTSPIDRAAIDEFLKEYDERTQDIHQYGDFHDQALDDASLQLTDRPSL
jgi:hypothetical protein